MSPVVVRNWGIGAVAFCGSTRSRAPKQQAAPTTATVVRRANIFQWEAATRPTALSAVMATVLHVSCPRAGCKTELKACFSGRYSSAIIASHATFPPRHLVFVQPCDPNLVFFNFKHRSAHPSDIPHLRTTASKLNTIFRIRIDQTLAPATSTSSVSRWQTRV